MKDYETTTNTNSLILFQKAALMLAEADTIQKAKELKDLALTAADWAKRRDMGSEAIQYARSYALEAERKMGEMLQETERAKGGRPTETSSSVEPVLEPTLAELGLTKKESSRAQLLANIPDEDFQSLKSNQLKISDIIREQKRQHIIDKLEDISVREVKELEGVYDVVVIDPPWDMQKIERDERPNQAEFDYPTMTEEELENLYIPCAEDCHVWLWTTHKFLPMALRLLDIWGLKYVCTFVWHKPGGFQPIGLPQYNCEFVLYARKGTPQFIDTKAFNVCFEAPRGNHSEKPEEFYELIRRVTAGRRLDMFNRRKIQGFEGWGNESC